MPYRIEHDHSECSGHAVIQDDDGKLMGCHETMAEAEAQMAALYAAMDNEKKAVKAGARNSAMDAERIQTIHDRTVELGAMCLVKTDSMPILSEMKAVKMLGSNRLGGYAVLWGSDTERDLDGEYFDQATEEMTSIFVAVGRLPYLYNHASDGVAKSTVVGIVDVLASDDVGLWYEAQLDLANKYVGVIRKLIGKRALGTSSGTLPNARRVEKSGRIARWPVIELSATPTPADYRQISERPLTEIKSIFQAIGLDFGQSIKAIDEHPVKAALPEADQQSAATVTEQTKKTKRLTLELELLQLT